MIDNLIDLLYTGLSQIPDHRRTDNERITYGLEDCLMGGFAMFSLKDPSLHQFRNNYEERSANLKRIYKLGSLPSDTTLRETIDGVNPDDIKGQFHLLFDYFKAENLLDDHKVLTDYIAISNDGTGQFCSCKTKCPYCLVKKHRNGKESNYHQLFASAIVSPHQKTVFPITAEPIVRQTEADSKNDCELNASKRAIPAIRQIIPAGKIIMLYDALYANAPHIRELRKQENDLSFIINIKSGFIFTQLEQLEKQGELETITWQKNGKTFELCFRENLILNESNSDVFVTFFEYREIDNKTGKVLFYGSWITDLPLSQFDNSQLVELVAVARSRWKIENETFNTLKNQGYHLEHNYGHGKRYLATNFALLTLLAFLVDQMTQHTNKQFLKALCKAKTKKNLWEKVRQVFDWFPCMSMNVIYQLISKDIVVDFPLIE